MIVSCNFDKSADFHINNNVYDVTNDDDRYLVDKLFVMIRDLEFHFLKKLNNG